MSAPRTPYRPPQKKNHFFWIFVNLILVAVTGLVCYRKTHRQPPPEIVAMPTPIASPSSTQAPFTAPVLVPTLGATPTPAATPTPTLSAAAPPIVLTQVDRRALPRVVVLLKPRVFAILDSQGRSIGSVDAAAGIRVDLVGIVDDQRVEVRMGSSLQVIPAAETDIVPRIRTELKHLVPLGNAAGDAAVSGTGLRG